MDKQMLDRYLNSFSRLTGLKVSLIDSRFRGIVVRGYDVGEYCSILHTSQKCLEVCIESNIDAFNNSKESGEPYIYRCPFGLGEIVVPVKEGNAAVGYLITGPILDTEERSEELLKKHFYENGLDVSGERAEEAIGRIRRSSAEEVRAVCDMLSLLADYIGREGFMRESEKTVGQLVKDYVKRNLSRKITLADLSLQTHCSTVTLTEHFRREFGMSVMEYVMIKRMLLAEELLSNSRLSVAEISGRCGFCDAEYFSKCFKRFRGVSPAKFRKQCKNK